MKTEYTLRELTPGEMICPPWGGCPAIYELERKTPEEMCPPFGTCPDIYQGKEGTPQENNYIIVGKLIDSSEFGLEGRVGEGEVLISIPKRLIDEKRE